MRCQGTNCDRDTRSDTAIYCSPHAKQFRRTGRTLPLWWRKCPNAVEVDGETTWILLTDTLGRSCGKTAVDTSAYERVKHLRWGLLDHRGYVVHHKPKIYLHRMLTGAEEGMDVDHIDGDPLNNRGSNMRVVSHALNCQNVVKRPERPSVRNVYFYAGRRLPWLVRAIRDGKKYRAGYFATLEEAEAVAKSLREDTFTHHNEERHI